IDEKETSNRRHGSGTSFTAGVRISMGSLVGPGGPRAPPRDFQHELQRIREGVRCRRGCPAIASARVSYLTALSAGVLRCAAIVGSPSGPKCARAGCLGAHSYNGLETAWQGGA